MSGALISGGPAAPFSLTIRGSRLTHNLFVIHEQGKLGGNVSATPNEKYQLPYVLPESVSLETSADDIGGTLTFTVDEPITPSVGPWWQDEKLPDNAVVEYGQGTEVDPYNPGQTRLFVGFVESIDAVPNAGGQGTTAQVTCVSTNAILDRIVVRRPVPRNKRGLAYGKVTIKAGTDAYQIKKILKLVSGARKYGSLLIFDPTKYTKIAETATGLPALEVRIETLRAALESVVEAAQEKDGKRRAFHVDPATGSLVYGYADPSEVALPTAPWEIVDQPEDEDLATYSTSGLDGTIRALGPSLYYRCDEPSGKLNSRPRPDGSASGPALSRQGAATGGYREPGPFADGVPNNYAIGISNEYLLDQWFPGTGTPTPTRFGPIGSRTMVAFIRNYAKIYIGGATITNNIASVQLYPSTTDGASTRRATASMWYDTGFAEDVGLSELAGGADDWHMVAYVMNTSAPLGPEQQRMHVWWPGGELHPGAAGAGSSPAGPAYIIVNIGEFYLGPGNGNSAVAAIAFFPRALTENELRTIWEAGTIEIGANAIAPRDLQMAVDHSRIVKSAIFLTADSAADADTEPDAYGRNYDTLKNAAGTGLAFAKRSGVKFMAAVEAPTVRSGDAATRSAKVNSLARAYFTTRRKPELGLSLRIRGAGNRPGQRFGFNGGWATANDGLTYVTGWRPGQFVSVTNQALGLDGLYRVESVTQTFEPGGFIRAFDIELERRPRNSVARLMIAQ